MNSRQVRTSLASAFAIALLFLLSACSPQSQTLSETKDVGATPPLGAETPAQFDQLPQLNGPATVEMKIKGQVVTIALDGQSAPVTAGNFVDLVQRGIYNGTKFHRVVRSPQPFVVQGGDPQSKDPSVPPQQLGTGGFIDPDTQKPRNIPLEILPEAAATPIYSQTLSAAKISKAPHLQHKRGVVAMARSPLPDSASSQFYFALSDLPGLDGDYAVFGSVTQGMDVVDQIEQGDLLESAAVTQGLENLK